MFGFSFGGGSSRTSSSSTTSKILSPEQLQSLSLLFNQGSGLISDPTQGLAPLKTADRESVNQRYAALPGQLSSQVARSGFSDSGKLYEGLLNLDLSRSSELAGVDNNYADKALQQKNLGYQLLMQILQQTLGSKTDTKGSTSGFNFGIGGSNR